jgi:hypothetical protein
MQLYPSAPATFASFWKRREPVVAAHYAEFSLARARVIRLRHDELGYASYHLADHLAPRRSSCECRPESRADAFAETASPTWPCRRSPREPDEKLLSTPFVPTRVNIDPVFLTAGPIWPEPAAAPVHLAMNDLLPPSNPGTGPGFPPLLPILCRGQPSPPHLPRHARAQTLIHLRHSLGLQASPLAIFGWGTTFCRLEGPRALSERRALQNARESRFLLRRHRSE